MIDAASVKTDNLSPNVVINFKPESYHKWNNLILKKKITLSNIQMSAPVGLPSKST